jgi:CDGSH-type Zn-finger protein
MYQIPYNSKGPEKNKYGAFCTAGMKCKRCQWFIKQTSCTFLVLGKKKTARATVCGFNKKPYCDMAHSLMLYEGRI